MENDRVLAIVKFGKRQYIDQLVQGFLYMNTLDYFIRSEGDPTRHDPDEGLTWVKQADGGKLQLSVGDEYQDVGTLSGPVRYRRDESDKANVFCMYALLESVLSNTPPIHLDNMQFGDTFAVLMDFDEFMRRVKRAARPLGQGLEWRLVDYQDHNTYSGPLGLFRKSSRFKYQSEFRIALLPGTGTVHSLDIGDISDIVSVGPLDELNNRLKYVTGSAASTVARNPVLIGFIGSLPFVTS